MHVIGLVVVALRPVAFSLLLYFQVFVLALLTLTALHEWVCLCVGLRKAHCTKVRRMKKVW